MTRDWFEELIRDIAKGIDANNLFYIEDAMNEYDRLQKEIEHLRALLLVKRSSVCGNCEHYEIHWCYKHGRVEAQENGFCAEWEERE